jgi:hypothetical protein
MKRTLILFIGIILFSIASSMPTLKLQYENISAGETIFGKIELKNGKFISSIADSDIEFYEGRKNIFIESGIYFFDNNYYFYAYPNRQGSFNLTIKNILYEEEGNLKSATINKNIEIKKNDYDILSIKPAVVYMQKEPKIKFTNLGNSQLNLSVVLSSKNTQKISLQPMQSEEISYIPSKNLTLLEIKSYKTFYVPIIHIINQNITPHIKQGQLRFSEEINKNLTVESKTNTTIMLLNIGDEKITNIKANSELSFLKFSEIKDINENKESILTIFFSPKNQGNIEGEINITYTQYNNTQVLKIPLNLLILPKGADPNNFTTKTETCEELFGKICKQEIEICVGESTWARGRYCCLGECEIIEEPKKETNWVIIILIIILIVIIMFLIYNKVKKTKAKNPQEKLQEISKKYSEKIQGKV